MLSRIYAFAAATIALLPPLLRATGGSVQLMAARKKVATNARLDKEETIASQLFSQELAPTIGNKVTVVGAGQVGMATAITLLAQNVTNEICLIDIDENRLQGELLDLQQGSCFLNSPKITGGCDYAATACSRVCVVTAGAVQKTGETRLDLVQRNGDILKDVIPQLVQHSPDTILLIANNPVDVMTFVAWKLSGLPKKRVFGSGTSLDSARFRRFISQRLGVSPASCHGWIVGEHGDSSVAVWSGVEVGGVLLRDLNPDIGLKEDAEEWHRLHGQVIRAGYEIVKFKGYTSWAVGLCCSSIVAAILGNSDNIMALSTLAEGQQCIEEEVFLSLPCTLNSSGISAIVQLVLSDYERKALLKSARVLRDAQAKMKF